MDGLVDTNCINFVWRRGECRIKYGCSGGTHFTPYLEMNSMRAFHTVVENHTRWGLGSQELRWALRCISKVHDLLLCFLHLLPSASSLIQMMRDALNTKMGYKWKWKTIPTFKDLTKSGPHPSLFPALCLSLSPSPFSKTRCTYYIKEKCQNPGSVLPFLLGIFYPTPSVPEYILVLLVCPPVSSCSPFPHSLV